MDKAENNIHVVIFSNDQEERTRYRKIITSINALKNTMPHSSTLSYNECKQGWIQNLEECFEAADVTLLLISLGFIGSPHYRREIEIALQKHNHGKTRLIPVLLSPVVWEESHLGELKPLPSDGNPISKWPSADDAITDISHNIREVIQRILKDRGYIERQDEDTAEVDNTSVSSTAFNWTDSITPFNYLTFTGKDPEEGLSPRSCRRMIMRVVYEHQKVSLGDSLSEQEICARVQQKSNNEYDFQDCQRDLKYLVSHLNLVPMGDMTSMTASIEAFNNLTRKVLYEATSDGFEIEKLIEKRMQASRARLSKDDLSDVKQKLFKINEYMTRKDELKQEDSDEIEDKWKSVFETWERIVASSRDYLITLARNAQYGQYDFDRYIEYKNTVTMYVQSFASTLLDISHEINELFVGWSQKKEQLIWIIAESGYRNHPDLENRPALETFVEQIRSQMTSLETWFKEKAHIFYERAASEIHRLVNRATSLALYHRSNVNKVAELKKVAMLLAQETSFEQAHQLFDAALSHVVPLHLSESLAGYAQIYEQAEIKVSVWDELAPARLVLIPTKQKNGNTGTRRPEDPIVEKKQESYALLAEEMRKDTEYKQRFARLFAQCLLSLDTLGIVDPLDRALLEEIIDGCLNCSGCQHQDEMGNRVVLLNPYEQKYIHLASHDGILFLPCYQLQWQKT